LRYGVGKTGPRLLITAGVHGDEPEPMLAVDRLARRLAETEFRGEATLCPVVNEAAHCRGRRTAEDGLDLARTCPGTAEGSVTERTAFVVSRLIQNAEYYIDLHTGGLAYDMLPLAGYMLHPSREILDGQRRMAVAFGMPLVWGTDHRLQGRTLSVARDAGVPAIYVECGRKILDATTWPDRLAEGCLAVMDCLGMIDDAACPQGKAAVQYFVEDPRSGSGYLQACHPAPWSGIFEPRVAVGRHIEIGEPIGRIVDVAAGKSEMICAAERGLIVALAELGRLRRGDGVAVVVDLSLHQGAWHQAEWHCARPCPSVQRQANGQGMDRGDRP
jgi:predicted deacylase